MLFDADRHELAPDFCKPGASISDYRSIFISGAERAYGLAAAIVAMNSRTVRPLEATRCRAE